MRSVWDFPRPPAVDDAPSPGFEALTGHVAFYPGRIDACCLDDPIKDGPGTRGW